MPKTAASKLDRLGVPLELMPMEARQVAALPTGAGWQYEPKWDGFGCLAFRADGEVELRPKSGKSLSRFFPEVLDNLRALKQRHFGPDGELTIALEGAPSFDALQSRLHPAASRIRRLAGEAPATLTVFDCLLAAPGKPLLSAPLAERRALLDRRFAPLIGEA